MSTGWSLLGFHWHKWYLMELNSSVFIMQNLIYYDEKVDPSKQPLMAPIVRIESHLQRGRPRFPSNVSTMSEYDIPLDEKWEVEKEKYVLDALLRINILKRFLWCPV